MADFIYTDNIYCNDEYVSIPSHARFPIGDMVKIRELATLAVSAYKEAKGFLSYVAFNYTPSIEFGYHDPGKPETFEVSEAENARRWELLYLKIFPSIVVPEKQYRCSIYYDIGEKHCKYTLELRFDVDVIVD